VCEPLKVTHDGFIKGKSAIHLARNFGGRKKNFSGCHFWARGYYVSNRQLQQQIAQCDLSMEKHLAAIAERTHPKQEPGQSASPPEGASAKASKRRKPPGVLELSLAGHLKRLLGVDLTAIPGLNVLAVLSLVSEIGTNMSKWRHEKAFASWLGLSPSSTV
jgi:hypothetical protein